jgi:glycosyltransferase involved in cell wall biosynthesis
MQERKKRRIVIASVLKPIDDTRMHGKIGQSLAETGKFDVHIFGYPSSRPISSDTIQVYSSHSFKRLSITRLLQPWRLIGRIVRLTPDLLIITTHELLFMAMLAKLFTRCGVIYDLQENYYRNIRYTQAYPKILRPLLATYVRLKEIILAPAIDYFILAEKGYSEELPFLKQNYIALENKLRKPTVTFPKKSREDKNIHLLFSGTLAESTGVFEAIDLARSLYAQEPRIRLTIIGYSSHTSVLTRIARMAEQHRYISLIGGDKLIPHPEIVQQILQSDFGIISYPPNKSTENCIPTKLFEYAGCKLPMLLVNHAPWVERCIAYNACIPIDFRNPDIPAILYNMQHQQFYPADPQGVYWEEEAGKLVGLMEYILITEKN